MLEKLENLTGAKKIVTILVLVVVFYGFSTGASFLFFSLMAAPATTITSPLPELEKVEQFAGPKTEPCPLNGEFRTKEEKAIWEKRRPLGVMIENHQEARPQSGLTAADIIYEAVAEGGITRFLAIYYCQDTEILGPVRSTRVYYLDWASEYGPKPLYAHVGGANTQGPANALGKIRDWDWYLKNDLDQFALGFPTYWRDYERIGHPVATEHTMYSTTDKLWQAAQKRNLGPEDEKGNRWDKDFISWGFKKDLEENLRPESYSAVMNFWDENNTYTVRWEYDRVTNTYKRFQDSNPHKDLINDAQLVAKVVIIQFQEESRANDGYPGDVHLLYKTTGKGKAVILQDGKVTIGEWQKKDRLSRTKFVDNKGKEIEFNRGQIWIQTVPTYAVVKY